MSLNLPNDEKGVILLRFSTFVNTHVREFDENSYFRREIKINSLILLGKVQTTADHNTRKPIVQNVVATFVHNVPKLEPSEPNKRLKRRPGDSSETSHSTF